MPQYYPLSTPARTGKVIDRALIEYELDRIARAHSTHSTSDFAASSVASSILVAPYTQFSVPFGIVGSWNLGAVTTANKLAGMIWPFGTAYITGGYITAEEARDTAAGPPATISLNLYQGSTKVWDTAPTIGNDEYATYGPTVKTTLTAPTSPTITQGTEITLRATGTLTTFKNVIFHLLCYAEHTG